ncbi:MAG: DNA (cytosine-5-)-methyltransferase [Bacteroidales bacterium]|nr:DNA (cytosine-5-)-methyltransferase [Bacteroidales bacterium]
MNYFSLFSGIGAFEKALKNLAVDFELVGYCEIDKYASKSYSAIHNVPESMNYGDITKIDVSALPNDIDLITYGFPCQDISLAGKQKGLFNEDGSQTRSGLFFEALRIIESTKPKVAIAENVKNLTSKKFNAQFQIVLASLDAAGYNNYWQVLNAKDYGVPQNRERVFIISIRKDIDTGMFKFPESFPLEKRLKDVLESEVDEKYYLSSQAYEKLVRHKNKIVENDTPDASGCIHAGYYKMGGRDQQYVKEPVVNQIGNCCPTKSRENPNQGRVYDADGLSPTLHSMQGGNLQPMVVVEPKIVKAGQIEGSYDQSGRVYSPEGLSPTVMSNSHGNTTGGYNPPKVLVPEPTIQRVDIPQTVKVRKYPVDCKLLCECLRDHKSASNFSNKEIAKTLDVPITKVEHWFRQDDCFAIPDPEVWMQLKTLLNIETDEFDESIMTFEEKEGVFEKSERHYFADGIAPTLTSTTAAEKVIEPSLRIRKLTPKECFRLMGFSDEDFEKAEAVNSNTQLYKQAGNSIVVPVLEHIFKALFDCGALENKKRSTEEMELRVTKPTFPEIIEFNFSELKEEITKKASEYTSLVYTEDQIQDAKKDLATLRKFIRVLSDERIKVKKECLKPYEDFEAKIKELDAIVGGAITNIDGQVKAYDEKKKAEKLVAIEAYFSGRNPFDWLKLEQIFSDKWLNASVKMPNVTTEIDAAIEQIEKDLATLQNLPEFGFEATEEYKQSLDINKAISEGHRLAELQKKKAELEAKEKPTLDIAPQNTGYAVGTIASEEVHLEIMGKQWVAFQALLSTEDAVALKDFFSSRNIQFERI